MRSEWNVKKAMAMLPEDYFAPLREAFLKKQQEATMKIGDLVTPKEKGNVYEGELIKVIEIYPDRVVGRIIIAGKNAPNGVGEYTKFSIGYARVIGDSELREFLVGRTESDWGMVEGCAVRVQKTVVGIQVTVGDVFDRTFSQNGIRQIRDLANKILDWMEAAK